MQKIEPINRLFGEIEIPGDKSISHRAVMIGSIAKGTTAIKGLLDCDDSNYTSRAFQDMGIVIRKEAGYTIIEGNGLKGLKRPDGPIHLGNSGTSIRLLAGILSGQGFEVALTGDESLSKRPMGRVVEPLRLMSADIRCNPDGCPPIKIKGGWPRAIDYKMPIPSAQVKSAILFAGLYADGVTRLEETFKSRDHTERMLKYFGSEIKVRGMVVSLRGCRELSAKSLNIPGDISSASFFIAAATLLKGSKLRINKVGINPTRTGILKILSMMGADIKIVNQRDAFEPVGDIEVKYAPTRGIVVEEALIPSVIDELPIIFVIASLSKGETVIKGARELRVKETDRIASMKENLREMGVNIRVDGDAVIIDGSEVLKGGRLKSFNDHRTCMSMAIAALAAKGVSTIDGAESVAKSFPEFFQVLERLKQ